MFGMSDKFGLMQLESIQNRYLDGNRVLNCSDQTAAEVDARETVPPKQGVFSHVPEDFDKK